MITEAWERVAQLLSSKQESTLPFPWASGGSFNKWDTLCKARLWIPRGHHRKRFFQMGGLHLVKLCTLTCCGCFGPLPSGGTPLWELGSLISHFNMWQTPGVPWASPLMEGEGRDVLEESWIWPSYPEKEIFCVSSTSKLSQQYRADQFQLYGNPSSTGTASLLFILRSPQHPLTLLPSLGVSWCFCETPPNMENFQHVSNKEKWYVLLFPC